MTSLFVDSFYFFAILNPKDSAHARAIEFSRQHTAPLVTTTWVFTEVADGLAKGVDRTPVRRIVTAFRAVPGNQVVETSDELFEKGFDLYDDRSDKEWSLTERISFIVIEHRGIMEALTGDHHFEQAGFTALLK